MAFLVNKRKYINTPHYHCSNKYVVIVYFADAYVGLIGERVFGKTAEFIGFLRLPSREVVLTNLTQKYSKKSHIACLSSS